MEMETEKKSGKSAQDELREGSRTSPVDEEFAEKIYEEQAPVAEQFDEEHEVSMTGGELREGTPSGVDAPPPSD
jgi:hypothetical protein